MPLDQATMQGYLAEQAARLAEARASGGRVDLVTLKLAFLHLVPTSQEVVAWAWWGCPPEAVGAKDLLELEADLRLRRGGVARAARRLGITHQSATERLARAKVELGALVASITTTEAGPWVGDRPPGRLPTHNPRPPEARHRSLPSGAGFRVITKKIREREPRRTPKPA